MKESTLIESRKDISKKKNCISDFITEIKKNWELYLLFVPTLFFFLIFLYKPMLGIVIAFLDYSPFKGIAGSKWIGFENFVNFFTGPYFWATFKNTIILSLYSMLFEFPAAIVFAIMLNEVKNKFFKSFVQTVSFLPHLISAVVVCGIVINVLSPSSGIVNIILRKLGFEEIYFLAKPQYFRGVFVSMNIWQQTGFSALVYIAALMGVDQNLYEAGKVDGVNKFQEIFYITLPAIMPTIVVMFILRAGNLLKLGFEKVLLLYQPSTYETADIISTYVYRVGVLTQDYGLATAVGLFNSVTSILLVYTANYISKKYTENSLW